MGHLPHEPLSLSHICIYIHILSNRRKMEGLNAVVPWPLSFFKSLDLSNMCAHRYIYIHIYIYMYIYIYMANRSRRHGVPTSRFWVDGVDGVDGDRQGMGDSWVSGWANLAFNALSGSASRRFTIQSECRCMCMQICTIMDIHIFMYVYIHERYIYIYTYILSNT